MRKQYNIDVDAVGEEFYTYNELGALASQERMFKLTGPNMYENYNAGEISATSFFDDFVLYPNPYLVVTPSGYSKYYYAGRERIASSIGGDGLLEETIIEVNGDYQNMSNDLFYNVFDWQIELINYDIPDILETYVQGEEYLTIDHIYAGWYSLDSGYELPENRLTEVNTYKEHAFVESYVRSSVGTSSYQGIYYTHSDHIGSAAWITDQDGTAVQHLQYLPWGEVFADQRLTDYSTRYTFSGKERDAETGFSYFGARYYLSEYGFWGGVDPLSDKYPSISSYAYCANNPVMLVDPDGRVVRVAGNEELTMIKNTLPIEARHYVKLGEDNIIDKTLLNSCDIKSKNLVNLKILVNSDDIIQVILDDKFRCAEGDVTKIHTMGYIPYDSQYPEDLDVDCNYVSGLSTGESGFIGKTLFPDKDGVQNSPTNDIIVIVNKHLSPAGRAETYSHEANGHALLYLLSGKNHKAASHDFKIGSIDNNLTLKYMIKESRKETIENMK